MLTTVYKKILLKKIVMKKKNLRYLGLLVFSFALILTTSCSSDDDGGDDKLPTGDMGTIEFTYTGDEEGERKGMADFDQISTSNTDTWEISGHDGIDGDQTFSITFMEVGRETIPDTGTYIIGGVNSSDFNAIVEFYEDGDYINSAEFSTLWADGLFGEDGETGTLEITHSSDSKVEGTFEFTAHLTEDDEQGIPHIIKEIEVKGKFSARDRISLEE